MKEGSKRDIGDVGERIACAFLERKGYRIIERNYRKNWGEVDIIAEKAGVVRFVEVKSVARSPLPDTSRDDEYRPEEMVHALKLRKIARVADYYMISKEDKREYQIDVVGVFMDEIHKMARCRLFENVM